MIRKITVVGTGYVGLSLATLLSQNVEVIALDILEEKVKKINDKVSPIEDALIKEYLKNKKLNLKATTNKEVAYANSDLIIIATPTDYDENTNKFNTKSIESTLEYLVNHNLNIPIVIKSTIPIGYVDSLEKKYHYKGEIMFSPEFLREGNALYDNLYPSRIVIGSTSKVAVEFTDLLKEQALNKDQVKVHFMSNKDAEAVKLFANTYLAMRVSFFNELDTFAELSKLDSKNIIEAVSSDPRIGNHYNNPSFGYGGYCLPKDTKQLKSNYENVPESIITSVVESNQIRKEHIANMIIRRNPKTVGVYKLAMKSGSDNFRQSSIIDVIHILENKGIRTIIYEPLLNNADEEYTVCNDLDYFKKQSDVIITNRIESVLKDVEDKVYTRDVFNRD